MTFPVGTWVKCAGYKRFGYIVEVLEGTDGMPDGILIAMPTKKGKFKSSVFEGWEGISPAPIEPMGDVSTRFKKVLIDIALMDKDEEWFKELVNHKSFM